VKSNRKRTQIVFDSRLLCRLSDEIAKRLHRIVLF